MGHPAFRRQPAPGMIARSASWLPHTHTHAETRANVARIQNASSCVLGLVAAPRPGREAAERDLTRLSGLLPPFVSRCTSGKQTVHGLVERPCIFRALCENFHPPLSSAFLLPARLHPLSPPPLPLTATFRPAVPSLPHWLDVVVLLGWKDRDLVFLL